MRDKIGAGVIGIAVFFGIVLMSPGDWAKADNSGRQNVFYLNSYSNGYIWSDIFANFDGYIWSSGLAESAAINVWAEQE